MARYNEQIHPTVAEETLGALEVTSHIAFSAVLEAFQQYRETAATTAQLNQLIFADAITLEKLQHQIEAALNEARGASLPDEERISSFGEKVVIIKNAIAELQEASKRTLPCSLEFSIDLSSSHAVNQTQSVIRVRITTLRNEETEEEMIQLQLMPESLYALITGQSATETVDHNLETSAGILTLSGRIDSTNPDQITWITRSLEGIRSETLEIYMQALDIVIASTDVRGDAEAAQVHSLLKPDDFTTAANQLLATIVKIVSPENQETVPIDWTLPRFHTTMEAQSIAGMVWSILDTYETAVEKDQLPLFLELKSKLHEILKISEEDTSRPDFPYYGGIIVILTLLTIREAYASVKSDGNAEVIHGVLSLLCLFVDIVIVMLYISEANGETALE